MVYTMSYITKSIFLRILCLWLVSVTASASGGIGNLTGANDTFLEVEEAYRALIEVESDNLTVHWSIEPGYYLYRDKFKLEYLSDAATGPLEGQYQTGIMQFDEYFDKELEIFYNSTSITVPIAGLPDEFTLKMGSQGCADAGLCYAPRTQHFDINLKFQTAVETAAPGPGAGPGGGSNGGGLTTGISTGVTFRSLLVYWLLAAGGGLILNLMPCVFPVLSLKALSFAGSSGSNHSHHLHGWAYTAGVVVSFLVAASLILIARAAGESAGWGFQLQSPVFVGLMTYLFLIMGLSLSGMLQLGSGLMGMGQGLTASSGLKGSFFTGVLAAVVASPCTGPLMAPALGFALVQSPLVALSVFIALGLGMALPFLLLSYSPRMAQLLPRPGTWMVKLKELLAFPMYLTAAWLLYVFGRQVGMTGVFFLSIGGVVIALSIWMLQNLPDRNWLRRTQQTTAVSALVFAGYIVWASESFLDDTSDWQAFSEDRVEALRNEGRMVFVDFTADWCITCKTNKVVALSRDGFMEAVEKYGVALLQADWTNEDPDISRVLQSFNRSGVPLYILYPADPAAEPLVLPQILTQSMVVNAMAQTAAGEKIAIK